MSTDERLGVITLRGLTARGVHGVLPQERTSAQPFSVDVSLLVDTSRAAASDDIVDTVSYAEVADEIADILTGPSVQLIETLAHRIADRMMVRGGVVGATVTVHKPQAPIDHVFADVSVTVCRGAAIGGRGLTEGIGAVGSPSVEAGAPVVDEVAAETTVEKAAPVAAEPAVEERAVVLALGGNIGDVPTTLMTAIAILIETPGVVVDEVSPLLRTRAILGADQAPQDDYWNCVVLARTSLEPRALLGVARGIEAEFGRVRVEHWGPRTIDIDIIQYEGVQSDDADLTLPHPRVRQRAFVLAPWAMADPTAVLEGKGRVADLLELTPDREGIRDAVADWLEDPGTIIAESDALLADQGADDEGAAGRAAEDSGAAGAVEGEGPQRLADAVAAGPAVAPTVNTMSRLDLVPEASKTGLAPADGGTDLVWRRLWETWASTPVAAGAASRPMPPPPNPDELRPLEVAAFPRTVNEAAPPPNVDEPRPLKETLDTPFAEPPRETKRDEADVDAPQAADAQESAQDVEDDHARSDAEAVAGRRRRPQWIPRFGSARSESAGGRPAGRGKTPAGDRREPVDPSTLPASMLRAPSWDSIKNPTSTPVQGIDTPAHSAAAGRASGASAPRLPQWNFARDEVRIVDDSALVDSAARNADVASTGRSILDPRLPEGTPVGPLEDDEVVQTGVMRKVVVRPTTTGQIPIKRTDQQS